MTDEPGTFRERLLDVQSMTPALREEYRKELEAMTRHTLTPRTRLLAWTALLAAAAGAVLCGRALVIHFSQRDARIVLPVFAAACLVTTVLLARLLWRGGFDRRASFAVVEGIGGAAAAVFVGVTLFRGMADPSNPASTFGGLMAILLVMVGFAWGTGNRIAAATLETREHLLRLESRLADLADRLPK